MPQRDSSGSAVCRQSKTEMAICMYTGQRVIKMGMPGRRKRGKPPKRFMDVVKEHILRVGGC